MNTVIPSDHHWPYAFLAFPHKLEQHDLKSNEVVTIEASTDGPLYQDGEKCLWY